MVSSHIAMDTRKPKNKDLPRRIGRYRILRELGHGGMGVVYEASDSQLDRRVAIKTMSAAREGDDISTRRFLLEARASARIPSSHIVNIYDFGVSQNGAMYIVMELLDGTSLLDLTRKGRPINGERARGIGEQLATALGAAHDAGIIHRDLKPSNVMLVERDGDPDYVKLLDFGVAKRTDTTLGVTRVGAVVGTPEFISPEQVRGDWVDGRSDVYSLGVLLYRMITGTRLFPKEPVEIPGFHHLHTPVEPPSKRAPEAAIPHALESVVLRCLRKEPEDRFQSMAELRQALEDCKQTRPAPVVFGARAPQDELELDVDGLLEGRAFVAAPAGGTFGEPRDDTVEFSGSWVFRKLGERPTAEVTGSGS
jgi:serine/threonine-protein kinase